MASSPNPEGARWRQEGRVVDAAWMAEHMPDLHPEWRPEDEDQAENAARKGMKGLMYKGKWLISPERQERTVRLFWVSGFIFIDFGGASETDVHGLDTMREAFAEATFELAFAHGFYDAGYVAFRSSCTTSSTVLECNRWKACCGSTELLFEGLC